MVRNPKTRRALLQEIIRRCKPTDMLFHSLVNLLSFPSFCGNELCVCVHSHGLERQMTPSEAHRVPCSIRHFTVSSWNDDKATNLQILPRAIRGFVKGSQ